jgi:hypothetical protein
MKALLLLMAALLPFTASADFRLGRVRTAAAAELKILSATGIYQNVKSAKISAQVTDGVSDNTSYALTLDGVAQSYRVVSTEGGYCGKTQQAYLDAITTGDAQVNLTVVDFSGATCERVINNLWEVTLTSVSIQDGSVSELTLGGNPEYFMLTM